MRVGEVLRVQAVNRGARVSLAEVVIELPDEETGLLRVRAIDADDQSWRSVHGTRSCTLIHRVQRSRTRGRPMTVSLRRVSGGLERDCRTGALMVRSSDRPWTWRTAARRFSSIRTMVRLMTRPPPTTVRMPRSTIRPGGGTPPLRPCGMSAHRLHGFGRFQAIGHIW
jgi:hypothetical protein